MISANNLFGTSKRSPNGLFKVIYSDGFGDEKGKWQKGYVALIREEKVLYINKVARPNNCLVGNDGTVACIDWVSTDGALKGKLHIFDVLGNLVYNKTVSANIGDLLLLSETSKYLVFDTMFANNRNGDKLFFIDIEKKSSQAIEKPEFNYEIIIEEAARRVRIKINDELLISFS